MRSARKLGFVCRSRLVALLSGLALLTTVPAASGQLVSLDRQDSTTHVGAQADFGIPNEDRTDDALYLRTDVYGQYVGRVVGGYASVPFSRRILHGPDDSAVGNIEVGLLVQAPIDPIALSFRLGLTLPTAGDNRAEGRTSALSSVVRYTDILSSLNETLGFRLSASPRFDNGTLFARADFGFDLIVDVDDGETLGDLYVLLRLNAAFGVSLGPLSVAAEWVNTADLRQNAPKGSDDTFLTTLGLSVWLGRWSWQPYAGITVPLDDSLREGVSVAVTAGLRVIP